MPAAAVIPAPIAYIKVVAVKKARSWISVEVNRCTFRVLFGLVSASSWGTYLDFIGRARFKTFTLRKLECSRQASALNTLAWNNNIGPSFYFVGF